jgi:hypothetical protein
MNKIARIIPFIAAAALMTACVSVSMHPIPVKGSSDECLVLIRTAVENKTSLSNMSSIKHYGFRFSDGLPAKEVSNTYIDYVSVVVKKEGTKITELYANIDRSMATGQDTKHALDISLPYNPGAVVVADFVFVQTLTEPSSGYVSTSLNFVEITPAQRDDILKRFAKSKNANSWM